MQYEELMQEKNALEKERILSEERFTSSESKCSSCSGRERSTSKQRRPSPVPATNPANPGSTHSSFDLNITPAQLNNLSNIELKVSNLADPAPYQCPICLANFHLENTYQIHLNKCVE